MIVGYCGNIIKKSNMKILSTLLKYIVMFPLIAVMYYFSLSVIIGSIASLACWNIAELFNFLIFWSSNPCMIGYRIFAWIFGIGFSICMLEEL